MSEVLKVPEGWEIKSLEELCEVVGGGTPKRDDEDNWLNGLIPWATPTDITAIKNSNFINGTKEKITEYGLKNSSSKLLPTNSILLTSRATIGARKINTIPMCTNQGFTSLIPKENNTKFLFYLLSRYEKYMNSRAYGTTFPEISKTEVKNVKVLLPSKMIEQQKIAKILSTLDSAIEASQKLIAKEKNIKKGLMHDLLTNGIDENGTIRSPKTHQYKESELGLIPVEWEIQILDDISVKISDGIHSTPEYTTHSEYFFINGNNLFHGNIELNDKAKCVSEDEYFKYKKELNTNTILLSINGTIGNISYYKNEKIILGKSVAYIICKDDIDMKYIGILLQSKQVKDFFNLGLTGSTIKNLSLKVIKNTPIPFPDEVEQQKIANILTAQDKKIETEEKNLEKLKELKKGLMYDLLSGKIRVKI
ncbi:restriction endonuclease subunit S [Sulfurimonas sp.]